jgi:uncharacterized RDD family membrane protein YckC
VLLLQYASFGKRFLAIIIDGFAINIIGSILIALWGIYGYLSVSWLIAAMYYILMEGGSWHATLGKRAMNITVVDVNCTGISYGTATIRYFGKILSALIFCIGYLMAAFSDTCQALHDKLANTYVVDGSAAPSVGAKPDIQPAGQVSSCRLIGITGEFAGKVFPVPANGILIGRDKVSCQIIFSANAQGISRHHCQVNFNRQSGMFVVNDLGSTYGTYSMTGVSIKSGQPMALGAGERFYLGSKSNTFEVRC